jgi:hypothetical protein
MMLWAACCVAPPVRSITVICFGITRGFSMAATWDHPNLGRFEYGDNGWTRMVDVPAFKAFSYDTGYSNAPRSKGKHKLVFGAIDESHLPSAADVTVAERVLANHAALVGVITRALWDDFNDRGPDSGMWWHDDLEAVAKSFKSHKLPPPTKPEDLLPLMQPSGILVREMPPGYDRRMVELTFHAAFEEEHGVSVLTDGEAVLGIGYNLDVTPFGFKPPPTPFG